MLNNSKCTDMQGKLYELGLFMYVLTQKQKSKDFDIGKEVKIADKFDDLAIRMNEQGSKNYTFVQTKLVDNAQINVIDADVLLGNKKISLKENDFNLEKYFISYLRIKDQLSSRNDNSSLKRLIIFTNAEIDRSLIVNNKKIGRMVKGKWADSIIPTTHCGAKCYKLKHTKSFNKKLLNDTKSDLKLISMELAKYITTTALEPMVLDKDYFKYYHTALIDEKVIEIQRVKQGNKESYIGQFTQEFIKNDSLSARAKKLRELIVFEITKKKLKEDALINTKFPVSSDFGGKRSGDTEMHLPTYNITSKDISNFFNVLEFRVNELDVNGLFTMIPYKQIKKSFLSYIDTDPRLIDFIVREFVEKWKCSEGSTIEGWILNSQRKQFIQDLQSNIYKPKTKHRTWEYVQDLHKIVKIFNLHFAEGCSLKEVPFFENKKVVSIRTDSTLLSSIKMIEYLKGRSQDDYIFIRIESLIKKEEVNEIIRTFQDKEFKLLILCYDTSLEDKLQQAICDNLFKIMQSNQKRIVLITSITDDSLSRKFGRKYNRKYKELRDNTILLEHIRNPSKILEQEIIFQDQLMPLNKLITQKEGQIKSIDAKTIVKLITGKGKEIKIGAKPSGVSDLEGAYLFEELNGEKLITNLVNISQEEVYVISGKAILYSDWVKERFINNKKFLLIKPNITILRHPYSIQSAATPIYLVDNCFEGGDFKNLCDSNPEKKVYWIKWNESNCMLQQIYNPNFYSIRQFNKVVIKTSFVKRDQVGILTQGTQSKFVFSGIDNYDNLSTLLHLETTQLDEDRIFVVRDKGKAREKFNTFRDNVHLLEVEKYKDKQQIIWHDSKGSLDDLRNYVDKYNTENVSQESSLLQTLQHKQSVIFADDPGTGKSTTLVKLYQSEYGSGNESKLVNSHWIINVNLREHLKAIKGIDINAINIPTILSAFSKNLEGDLAQSLLKLALSPKNVFKKPLLITFDGFDEVLDQEDREKVITLLKVLKDKSNAKTWVTTRLQHKESLEKALNTFAVSFKPLKPKMFIKKFFRDRLRLLLEDDNFMTIFGSSDEVKNNSRISEYTEAFFESMQSVFKGDVSRFIGAPSNLYLLLRSKGSLEAFTFWANNRNKHDFVYLGKNIYEIFKNVINGIYETYFNRIKIVENEDKQVKKLFFNICGKKLAKLKLGYSESKLLKVQEDMALSVGLIHSEGNTLEFIHPTFVEFFFSEVCMGWIKKETKTPNTNKQETLFNILINENESNHIIRSFINFKLEKNKYTIPDENLKQYGEIFKKLWNQGLLTTSDGRTIIHTTTTENNKEIIKFLINSIDKTCECEQLYYNLLTMKDNHQKTVLHECPSEFHEIIITLVRKMVLKLPPIHFYKLLYIKDGNLKTFLQNISDIENVYKNLAQLKRNDVYSTDEGVKELAYNIVYRCYKGALEPILSKAARDLSSEQICNVIQNQDNCGKTVLQCVFEIESWNPENFQKNIQGSSGLSAVREKLSPNLLHSILNNNNKFESPKYT